MTGMTQNNQNHLQKNSRRSKVVVMNSSRLPTSPSLSSSYALRSSLPLLVTHPSPRAAAAPEKHCTYCQTTTTPMWRHGPPPYDLLCNSCGVKYRRGKLILDTNTASPRSIPPRKPVKAGPPMTPWVNAQSSASDIKSISAASSPTTITNPNRNYPSPRRSISSPVAEPLPELSFQYSPPSPAPSQEVSMSPRRLLARTQMSLNAVFNLSEHWSPSEYMNTNNSNLVEDTSMLVDLDEFTRSVTTLYTDEEMGGGMVGEPQAETYLYTHSNSMLEERLAIFSAALKHVSVAQLTAIYTVIENTLMDDQRQLLAQGKVVDFDLSLLLMNDEAWNQILVSASS